MSIKIALLKENVSIIECLFLNAKTQSEARDSTVSIVKGSELLISEVLEEWVLCIMNDEKLLVPIDKVEIIEENAPKPSGTKFH